MRNVFIPLYLVIHPSYILSKDMVNMIKSSFVKVVDIHSDSDGYESPHLLHLSVFT